jgi:hypothetical protein
MVMSSEPMRNNAPGAFLAAVVFFAAGAAFLAGALAAGLAAVYSDDRKWR